MNDTEVELDSAADTIDVPLLLEKCDLSYMVTEPQFSPALRRWVQFSNDTHAVYVWPQHYSATIPPSTKNAATRYRFSSFILDIIMPRLSTLASRERSVATYDYIDPELARVASNHNIDPKRLTLKNRGEMVCLRLETGTHPAFPFIVTSLADAPASKLGYRTREEAVAAATDYVREHGKPFYVLRIVSKLEKKPTPVDVADWIEAPAEAPANG